MLRCIGEGGQAQVFLARDDATHSTIAIKVLLEPGGAAERITFQNEFQAAAQLRHPHVVRLFDAGLGAPDEAGRRQPYIAMELGERTVSSSAIESYEVLREVLEALLSALAHAHARGVVHCDVKPQNLVWVGGVVKLTDFGIARLRRHPREATTPDDPVWATPAYAAPELAGREPAIGPWTDLYAVGIAAFELSAGRLPFHGTPTELARLHATRRLPALNPRWPVPSGFVSWLHTLCAKDPVDRYQRAQEALDALRALGGARSAVPAPNARRPSEVSDDDTISMPLGVSAGRSDRGALGYLLAPPRFAATLPARHRELEVTSHLPASSAERETVLPMRPSPVAERQDAQARLFALFHRVATERAAQLCILRGPSGVGKSHLAKWLTQLTHEAGLANVLVARYGGGGPREGLHGMWLDYLGQGGGITWSSVMLRVDRALGGARGLEPVDRFALARFLVPEEAAPSGDETDAELHALMMRALAKCATRPLVVWLDDIHANPAALEFIAALRAHERWSSTPMLVLATVDDDDLSERTHGLLRALASRGTEFPLSWLDPASLRELLARAFHLAQPVAARLAERVAGSPLFATQQVIDWAQRGQLRRTAAGFDLVSLDDAPIPDALTAVWRARLEPILGDASDRACVELAAVLGVEVDAAELDAACGALGRTMSPTFKSELLGRRLAIATHGGFRFVHPMLRETLLLMAHEEGQSPALHRAAEAALRARYPRAAPRVAERRARHLRAAHENRRALESYLDAVEDAARRDDPLLEALLDEHAHLVDDIERPGDPTISPTERDAIVLEHRVCGRLALASAHAHAGRFVASWALVSSLEPDACPPRARVTLLCIQGHLRWTMQRGDGVTSIEKALQIAQQIGDGRAEALCVLELAHALQYQRTTLAAQRRYEEASRRFGALGDRWGEARSIFGAAVAARKNGDTSTEERLLQAADVFREVGSRRGLLMTFNERGVVAHRAGRLDDAADLFERGLQMAMTSNERSSLQSNLGLLLMEQRRFEQARTHLQAGLSEAEAQQAWGLWSAIQVDLAWSAAELGRWNEVNERVHLARAYLDQKQFAHPDTARHAERAASLAFEAEETPHARALLELALSQYAVLERDDDVVRVQQALDARARRCAPSNGTQR